MKKYKIEIITYDIFNDSTINDCVIYATDKMAAYSIVDTLSQIQDGALLQIYEI